MQRPLTSIFSAIHNHHEKNLSIFPFEFKNKLIISNFVKIAVFSTTITY